MKAKFLLAFFILFGISVFIIKYDVDKNIEYHLDNKTKIYHEAYHTTIEKYKEISKIIYSSHINTDEVKNIFQHATSANMEIKNSTRKELFEKLNKLNTQLNKFNLKQIHFHLPNNDSFLRFHRPDKYGDNLSGFRETVKYVNENKKFIYGFEKGRVYNGYRFVFPLTYHEKYLGSVEISFKSFAVSAEFMKNYNVVAPFLLLKNDVDRIVFEDEKYNYQASLLNNFYIEKTSIKSIKDMAKKLQVDENPAVSEETKKIFNESLQNDNHFSVYDDAMGEIITFIKVLNPITQKISAVLVVRSDGEFVQKQYRYFFFAIIVSMIALIIILFLIKIEIKSRKKLESSKDYLKSITDHSPNIIITAYNRKILTANSVFLKFVNINSLEEFTKDHKCICDIFVERRGFLQPYIEDEYWVDYVVSNPDKIHKAIMIKDGNEYIFRVSTSRLITDSFNRCVTTFVDITEMETIKERYEFAINGSQDGLWDWDLVTNGVYFSPQWKKQLGYEDNELKNKLDSWESRVHKDDLEKAMADIQANIDGKTEFYENTHRLKHKDGSWVWILDRGKTIFDENNNAIRMVGFHTDITREYESNSEIMHFKSAFERSPIAIIMTDVNANITYVNPTWSKVTGYTKEEVISKNPRFLQSGYLDEKAYETMWNTLSSGQVWSSDVRNKAKDGSIYWEESTILPMFDLEGNVDGYIGFKQEITKTKELQEELNKQIEQNLQKGTILENLINEVYIFDSKNLNFVYLNNSAIDNIGYTMNELKILTPLDIKPEITREKFKSILEPLNNDLDKVTFSTIHQRKDATRYPVDMYIQKTAFDDIDAYVAVVIDISERKEIEDKLQEKDEMLIAQSRHAAMGEMISMIAHQWRQPLSVISMGANNILADIELEMVDEDTLRDISLELIEQTNELSKIIDDFKEFFRPVKDMEELLVEEVIERSLGVIEKSLVNHNVTVIKDYNSTKKTQTYSRELMQVFINIINNAKEAAIEKDLKDGQIIITTKDEGNCVVVKFQDNAGGIPKDVLAKIFDPYFSTKTEKSGTGLGLYMSHTIVNKHLSGTIEAYNIDKGACFEIKLPYIIKTDKK